MAFRIVCSFLSLALAVGPLCAAEPEWPTKPVTVLVPFAAGGTVDFIARTVGQKLSAKLGKSFVIDNRGGAGVFAPAGTPPAIIERLHDAVNKAITDPEIAGKLAQQGLEVQALTREQFVQMVRGDLPKWAKVIKSLGIKGG